MFEKQTKTIKYVQGMAHKTEQMHQGIENDIDELKRQIMELDEYDEVVNSEEYRATLEQERNRPVVSVPLERKPFAKIWREAQKAIEGDVYIYDILDNDDVEEWNNRIEEHVRDFNKEYSLDPWDYAIAGSCGLVAGLIDCLCVAAPMKPSTTKFTTHVDGVFSQGVQKAFNAILPPDFSHQLSKKFTIGSADTSASTKSSLLSYVGKLNPYNHRMKELSHDPILGFIIGAKDIINNTCTIVENGKFTVYHSIKPNVFDGNFFHAMGQMFGHLASDINAPSAKGNRGMGLPAPFMGLFGMLDNVELNGQSIGKNVEYMYVKGYDMRHFLAASIPLALMEVFLRVGYIVKEMRQNNKTFVTALSQTAPGNMHKKFRMMTAISYGVLCAINAGKVHVTQNILNLNYAAWLGLAWNGFHALKWALVDRQFAVWQLVEKKELERLGNTIADIEALEGQAASLPV